MAASDLDKERAQQLHAEAMQLDSEGKCQEALDKYAEAIALHPEKSESHYNSGLILKYAGDWEKSFAFNKTAHDLAPGDEAARWNLGIAATALRDWRTARRMWSGVGLQLDIELDEPIELNMGLTPVRLNPDEGAEVVWARRIDPVRARIESIPLPESGYCHGDIVLHDGAAVGYRMNGDKKCPVFNVLELFEQSAFSTFSLTIDATSQESAAELLQLLSGEDMHAEDWSENIRTLCKACSEGEPHEEHDHDAEDDGTWKPQRSFGVAALSLEAVQQASAAWTGGTISEIECTLSAEGDEDDE